MHNFLTIKQAMAFLNCSKPTLYNYIRHYHLPVVKLIGKTLICKQSIENLLVTTPQNEVI